MADEKRNVEGIEHGITDRVVWRRRTDDATMAWIAVTHSVIGGLYLLLREDGGQKMTEWVVDVGGEPLDDLRLSFQHGPIVNDQGNRLFLEHEVGELNGLKIEVFSNEHPPPHFRVKFGGETNCFRISDGEPMYRNSLKQYFRNIKKWHKDNKQFLIDAWNNTRPADCPVGKYKG